MPPAEPGTPQDAELRRRFRDVMAGVATPVTVVTALADGLPHGTTVSAFASLSISPPMVLVSLDRGSDLLAVIRRTGHFGVNVLGATQSAVASAFARKGGAGRCHGRPWDLDHGLPRLPGSPGWLACAVADLVDGGDHVVVLGTVLAAETTAAETTGADTTVAAPLTYHGRVFGTHALLDA